MMKSTIPIIFSGWNLRATIAFCRFCRMRQIPFCIVARNNDDPILLSDYKSDVIFVRRAPSLSLDLLKQVVEIIKSKGYSTAMLMPLTEYLNRFFLSKRRELEEMGCQVPLCDSNLYEIISDKSKFEKLCERYEIPTPAEYDEILAENIPFVIKPRSYFFGAGSMVAEKPKLIMSISDFEKLGKIDKNTYYSQQYVDGGVYYLLCYFSRDGSYKIYSQKNFAQQHDGLSIIAAESSTIHNDKRVEQYINMFRSVGFHGLVMVEVRDFNDKLFMIEANPRFWGPSQLILDSGMDLFDLFAVDAGLLEKAIPSNYQSGVKYSWMGGFVETSSLGKNVVFHNGYNASEWVNQIYEWINSDIYRREDTIRLYNNCI